jgi:adenine-specific DNA-methyltransferase
MVQLPEVCDEKSEAYKAGYKNICEIGKERIRRAGDKIVEENPLLADKLDIGFKVFELSKSNIKKWNSDTKNLEEQIEFSEDNFEEGSKPLDIVYEILLKQGLDLTYPIKEHTLREVVVYDIAYGAMFVVLGEKITSDVAEFIKKEIGEQELENTVIVFQDEKFESDSEKLNIIEQLNEIGVKYDDILSI